MVRVPAIKASVLDSNHDGPTATTACMLVSGPQKGPSERGHVKKRQKSSKSDKNIFETFRHFSRRAKNVKNRQKVSKYFSTLFDNFRAAPVFRPLLGGSELDQPLSKRSLIDPNPQYLLESTAVQMGGVLPYKWEESCGASLSSKLRSQEGPAIQMGAVLPYKLECAAVLSSRPVDSE